MNEAKETTVNPCPYCKSAWVFFDRYDRRLWRTNCNCGFAWKIGKWKDTKEEATEVWNKKTKK